MESQSCVEFCRLSWCPDSIALNISVTPKSLFLTSTKGLLPEHWQTGHTVGGLVWDWVWEETPQGANNMVLVGNSFCFHSVVEWKVEVWKKLYRNKTEKKNKQDWKKEKKKKNETETPTVGLACLALTEWYLNIGLMNEWTPFCQVKESEEYHLLL